MNNIQIFIVEIIELLCLFLLTNNLTHECYGFTNFLDICCIINGNYRNASELFLTFLNCG